MIKIKEVQTKTLNKRVVRARKENIDDYIAYQLEFISNINSINTSNKCTKAILEPQQGATLISYTFELERGLYDVYITKIIARDSTSVTLDENTRTKYPEPIMVGEQYLIGIIVQEIESYNKQGIRVHIKSKEDISINNDALHYTIKNINIKYKIPFNNKNEIHFFIKDINKEDINFHVNNPIFKINTKYK